MAHLLAKREAIKAKRTQIGGPESFLKHLRSPSRQQYVSQHSLWQNFKAEMSEPDFVPDIDNFRLFAWWCASKSEGRLAEKADIKTLSFNVGRFARFYNGCHAFKISDKDLKDVREYIRTELAEELGLQNLEQDKEYADWEDIKIAIRYIIAEDAHVYNDSRFRVQIVCVFLLIAENGERIGAIARSESYREMEAALCYKDVKLFLRPASNADSGPEFKMTITYDNRKKERDKRENLVETYFQRADYAHCIIVWFLVLAFLDDALDNGINSPIDLFNMKNLGTSDDPIRFKRDKLSIPIFRRMQGCGSRKLSSNMPWSSSSVTSESHRIFREAGFPQRWTFYNMRRTMGNTLDDYNIGVTRRKKIMGHHGKSDTIFRTAYQSRLNTVDSGNIFRKEKPRQEKTEVLSMHLRRDPDALEIPDSLLTQILKNDEEVKELLNTRKELRSQRASFKGDPSHGCNEQTIKEALEHVKRALNRRRGFLRNQAKKDFRKSYFENPAAVRAQHPSARAPKKASRACLVDALYPENESGGSAVAAIEALIAHCRGEDQTNTPESSVSTSIGEIEVEADSQEITIATVGNKFKDTTAKKARKRKQETWWFPDPEHVAKHPRLGRNKPRGAMVYNSATGREEWRHF
ncbi:hypothetical protein EG329_004550 [Mollisiaceae sp. DMI_Dod_QoI]|nr:hypothetical protein EG329_004550 [Helotiales sp. DMI_Dod_QoI]